MELYVLGIGNVSNLKLWEDDLRSVKLPLDYVDPKTKKKVKSLIRLGVNRIIPYRLVFPEDQLDAVMSVVGVSKEESYVFQKYPILKKMAWTLRRILKLKKAPFPEKVIAHMQPNQFDKSVAVIPIGTKKDNTNKVGNEHI